MTVNRGLWVPINTGNVGTTDVEARLADNALFEPYDGTNARSGLLNPASAVIVTGTANMSYNVAACNPVINRAAGEGVYRFSATGVTNVTTTAAPGANSRIDIVWLKQNDQAKGDANNLAVAGVTQGAVAASPVAPAIPAGALELARATVGPLITATTAASITQTFRYAALRGSALPVRNTTERGEITAPRTGQRVERLDVGGTERWTGAAWDGETSSTTVAPPDSGWQIDGGLVRINAGTVKQVHATLKLTRLGAATAPINQTFAAFLLATIPSGWRPSVTSGVQASAVMSTTGGTFRANLEALIGTNGDIAFRVASGSLSLTQNDVFYIDMAWWQ